MTTYADQRAHDVTWMTAAEREALGDAQGWHVIRTRTRDSSVAHLQLAAPSQVGQVATSRTFADWTMASREANAWRNTGDWSADVCPGPAPLAACGNRTCTRIEPACTGRHA